MKQKDSPGILCCDVLYSTPLYSAHLLLSLSSHLCHPNQYYQYSPIFVAPKTSITLIFTHIRSSLREFGSMDLFTYHTLMMGHTKLGRHQKVLTLYNEALESSAKVRM